MLRAVTMLISRLRNWRRFVEQSVLPVLVLNIHQPRRAQPNPPAKDETLGKRDQTIDLQ